jgi:hypothetical protein
VQGYYLATHLGFDFGEMMKGSMDFKSGLMTILIMGLGVSLQSCHVVVD